jgi:hypothetical protein
MPGALDPIAEAKPELSFGNAFDAQGTAGQLKVRRCKVTRIESRDETAWSQRLM